MINVLTSLIGIGLSLAVTGLVKGIFYIREGLGKITTLETNHFPHMQAALEAIPPALERQTDAIVHELKENRADIRQLRDAVISKL